MNQSSSQPSADTHLQQNNIASQDQYQHSHSPTPDTQQDSLQPSGRFTEEWDASQRGSSIIEGRGAAAINNDGTADMERTQSVRSYNAGDDQQSLPHRGNTLKKKSSMRRSGSVNRSGSRRSLKAGSVRSLALQSGSNPDETHSAFFCPVPTSGNPTETLINRFQSWRKVLKDLIAYFREIQSHYEHRGKALLKLANVSNNIQSPPGFLKSAGIDDALQFLRVYNKNTIGEAAKAKEIEEDVILALTGLRSDLQQKIKEIKNLSGDFKNSVEKEMDVTRKAVRTLQDALGKHEADDASTTGRQDPFLLRLHVDRQVERQLDEENYLHQAYLNLESSGRELESIVVGEIQKAYNAYAGILKREADNAYSVIEELRDGPISMPKDQEWINFVTHEERFIDPTIPLRSAEQIHYPGQEHLSAQEIRAGLLERKSKYLRSYTAGWYVLSTTHLHEFKSADKGQAPVMSLYLPEQKLGSHSAEGGSSNKFILKGRQTGSMHRGHTWVFRAESHDTMIAWYEDIKALTEKTPEERSHFVRSHSRSLSQSSRRSASSDGIVDEDDDEPFSAGSQIDINPGPKSDTMSRRSQPGGRFPSDIQVNAQRGLQARSQSSLSSTTQEQRESQERQQQQQQDNSDAHVIAAATALPGTAPLETNYAQDQERQRGYGDTAQSPMHEIPSHAAIANSEAHHDGVNPYTSEPLRQNPVQPQPQPQSQPQQPTQNITNQHEQTFIAPVVASYREPVRDDNQVSDEQRQLNREQPVVDGFVQPIAADPAGKTEDIEQRQTNGGIGGREPLFAAGALPIPGSGFESGNLSQDSLLTDTTVEAQPLPRPVRPVDKTIRADSVNTISNLHIPGEYPRPSPA